MSSGKCDVYFTLNLIRAEHLAGATPKVDAIKALLAEKIGQ